MVDHKKDEPLHKVGERHPFSPAVETAPKKEDAPLRKLDPNHDKTVSTADRDGDTSGPAGLKREAIKPIAERGSGESGRTNQVEPNPHKAEDDEQPKEREFSGDVRRPGSPDVG